jgi:hypothetical protein
MKTHLFQCKYGDPLSKRIKLKKLEVCMLVMEELQKTYTVASVYRAIFIKAIQQIFPDYSAPVALYSSAINGATVSDTQNLTDNRLAGEEVLDHYAPLNDAEIDVLDESYFMQNLIDEASDFSFWETWNQA